MNQAVLHLLMNWAAAKVKYMSSPQRSSQLECRQCRSGVAANRSVTFDCCRSLLCFDCAGPMLTDLGGNEFLVQCGICGKRRLAKP